jgi:lysophospholipid acyltransferase (LPLAT)-like uncharacterized protein
MSGEPPNPQPPKPANRKSGVVVPHAPKWYQRLAAFLIWLAVNVVALTMRYRINDPGKVFQSRELKQVIYCVWHNRLALCAWIYRKCNRVRNPELRLAGLISASKDGALLADVFRWFNMEPVRGSSSRRGAQALMELTTWAERGYDLAITPDGPRGPRYVMAEGAITLAQVTGLPLVASTYNVGWKFSLNSWDKFQIPLPFSRCEVTIGKVFYIPKELTDADREKFRREIEAELNTITRD